MAGAFEPLAFETTAFEVPTMAGRVSVNTCRSASITASVEPMADIAVTIEKIDLRLVA